MGYMLGFGFMYIAVALIFYSLCITASNADDLMEQEAKEYWRTTYTCSKGSDVND